MEDALVILDHPGLLADVEATGGVRQRYGDRVLIVSGDAAARLGRVGGARVIAAGAPVADPPGDLSDIERIGVDAWNARVATPEKARRGEGLPWDAKGFEPP